MIYTKLEGGDEFLPSCLFVRFCCLQGCCWSLVWRWAFGVRLIGMFSKLDLDKEIQFPQRGFFWLTQLLSICPVAGWFRHSFKLLYVYIYVKNKLIICEHPLLLKFIYCFTLLPNCFVWRKTKQTKTNHKSMPVSAPLPFWLTAFLCCWVKTAASGNSFSWIN